MDKYNLLALNLKLFDGGAGAGASAGAAAGGEGAGAAQAEAKATPGSSRRGKTGGEDKVVYGRREAEEAPAAADQDGRTAEEGPDAGGNQNNGAAETPEQRKARFEALISGEFKDLFDERAQGIISRRFKQVKGLEEQLSASKPLMDMLAQRYSITDGDPAKLAQAVEADEAYWSEAAEKAGMDVPQYRQMLRLQRENEALRQAQLRQQGEREAQRQLQAWEQEAGEVKAVYQDFDLAAECRNPQFIGMLRSGVPMRHAYEVAHLEDIKSSTARQAAKQTEKQVTENIRAKGARPQENGTAAQSGVIVKSDPSKLTRADREEIARRVARGETIRF